MKHSLLNKQFPTLLGVIMLAITVFITSSIIRTGILFPIKASQSEEPKGVHITNITDSSFTVFYSTVSPETGSITYGENEEYGTVILDEKDLQAPQPHILHYITVNNLKPKTQYYFAILSGSSTYKNNDGSYRVTTANTVTGQDKRTRAVSGTVITPEGTAPNDAIILLEGTKTQTLATRIKSDGTYAMTFDTLLNENLETPVDLQDSALLKITVFGEQAEGSAVITASQLLKIPTVTLTQSYDFAVTNQLTSETEQASSSAIDSNQSSLPAFSTNKSVNTNPQILTPVKDQAFADLQPEFKGVAPPNRTIEIIIHSEGEIRTTVKANTSGVWTYRPKQTLSPGKHTISITTKDESGILRTIVQSFIVNAQGSQFTDPSVAPTMPITTPTTAQSRPTATPTTRPSITPLASPTPTTMTSLSPTASPTIFIPSPTVSPTTILITQQPTLPLKPPPSTPTGSNDTLIFAGLAVVAIVTGGMLFFLTQGGI
jgi:hypothetical protein